MKKIISILLFMFCTAALAGESMDQRDWSRVIYPDETSTEGLPEVIPCRSDDFQGKAFIVCTWLSSDRQVVVWDAQRQQNVRYWNKVRGRCIRGTCRISGGEVGEFGQDVEFTLAIWYRIGTSTDGKPVAYRLDTNRQVSYVEAGSTLIKFYLDSGIPDNKLASVFDVRYDGGYAAWQAQKGEVRAKTQQSTSAPSRFQWPEVKSAWCNPRMDDDCYINEEPVAIEDLGKWLPAIHPEEIAEVEQEGGYCETILCFSSADKPLGFKPQ
jgi:hypothetical protein